MTITFDGVTLKNVAAGYDKSPVVTTTKKQLASGKWSIQSTTETGFKRVYDCVTSSYSDITNLLAKIGGPYTLIEDGTSYTDCYITQWNYIREFSTSGYYEYGITIERDTA